MTSQITWLWWPKKILHQIFIYFSWFKEQRMRPTTSCLILKYLSRSSLTFVHIFSWTPSALVYLPNSIDLSVLISTCAYVRALSSRISPIKTEFTIYLDFFLHHLLIKGCFILSEQRGWERLVFLHINYAA